MRACAIWEWTAASAGASMESTSIGPAPGPTGYLVAPLNRIASSRPERLGDCGTPATIIQSRGEHISTFRVYANGRGPPFGQRRTDQSHWVLPDFRPARGGSVTEKRRRDRGLAAWQCGATSAGPGKSGGKDRAGHAGRGSFEPRRVACPAAYDLRFWLGEVDHRCGLGAAVAGVDHRVHGVLQLFGDDPPVGQRLVLAGQQQGA
jgi:hypothetical protein